MIDCGIVKPHFSAYRHCSSLFSRFPKCLPFIGVIYREQRVVSYSSIYWVAMSFVQMIVCCLVLSAIRSNVGKQSSIVSIWKICDFFKYLLFETNRRSSPTSNKTISTFASPRLRIKPSVLLNESPITNACCSYLLILN